MMAAQSDAIREKGSFTEEGKNIGWIDKNPLERQDDDNGRDGQEEDDEKMLMRMRMTTMSE